MITTLDREINTYNANYDVVTDIKTIGDLNNKLFCTFTDIDNLDPLLEKIKSKYTIIYNKLFVLEIVGNLKDACKDGKKAVDLGDTRPIEWVRNQC